MNIKYAKRMNARYINATVNELANGVTSVNTMTPREREEYDRMQYKLMMLSIIADLLNDLSEPEG